MKKVMIFMLLLSMTPVVASVNCIDNSRHLQEDFDDKEWHSIACDCPCTTIRKGYCVECGHLQNASTYVVVQPTKIVHNSLTTPKVYAFGNPHDVLRKLAKRYLETKMERE
jgi:hypothetical protein